MYRRAGWRTVVWVLVGVKVERRGLEGRKGFSSSGRVVRHQRLKISAAYKSYSLTVFFRFSLLGLQ